MRQVVVICCCLLATAAFGADINAQRAHFNYQMFCQGCHTPNGSGAGDVPQMKDQVGHFTRTATGREYLVQVPGSATSALNDANLAEVLNWVIREFSGTSLNDKFEPYTSAEVARLRKHPLNEVIQHRAEVLRGIVQADTGKSP